jgi:glycosyltransferase involved in cell wall biosynthesis
LPRTKVAIYDPNWMNPYGVELSSIIAEAGFDVDFWCTSNRKAVARGVRRWPRLALNRRQTPSTLTLAVQRVLAPLSVVRNTSRRTPLIVVWTRDPWDALVFTARALSGGKVVFIYHNPPSIRERGGWAGLAERILVRTSDMCVVHTNRLANASRPLARSVRVAAHPPYRETCRAAAVQVIETPAKTKLPTVGFVGALRADKGADKLVSIAESSGTEWILRVLGPDVIPSVTEGLLRDRGVTCEHIGSDTGPSDEELVHGLASVDIMLAPYTSVTESGSIHLALSMGVPVLAFESEGVSHIINARSLAPDSDALGRLVGRFFDEPWPTFTPDAMNLPEKCRMDWLGILKDVT